MSGNDDLYHIGTDGDFHGPEGLEVLRTPVGSPTVPQDAAEAAGFAAEASPPYRGVIVIEWPPPGPSPYSAMAGCLLCIFDAVTGRQILTVTHIKLHAPAAGVVTADLTLFAGGDGEPLFDGTPALDGDEVRTGTFPFVVAEMRVRQS